jgi:hypothetical protein
MLTDILWWLKCGLLAWMLIRGARSKLFTRYLLFFSYASFELAVTLTGYYIHTFNPIAYLGFYWYTEFLSVALGYGVTWEIYSHTFEEYPGTRRMARFVVGCLFLAVLSKEIFSGLLLEPGVGPKHVVELERDLRTVQAILLIIALLLIVYYGISLGRNLRGLLWGYGFFIGMSVITLQLRAYLGPSFQSQWSLLQQTSYIAALLIWSSALRSYQPSPVPTHEVELEEDYQYVAEQTLQAITRAKAYFVRTLIP